MLTAPSSICITKKSQPTWIWVSLKGLRSQAGWSLSHSIPWSQCHACYAFILAAPPSHPAPARVHMSHHVRAHVAVMESIRTRFLGDGLGQWMSAFPQCCQPVFKQMLPVFHHAETATPFSMGFIVLHLGRAKEGDWLEEFVLSADYWITWA